MKYQVEDYVEYQPRSGKSRNVRIVEVLENDKYKINSGKVISGKDILGRNLW